MANIRYIQDSKGNKFYFDAKTINGHTVSSDVPENVKFTDTTYHKLGYSNIYTEADIANGLVVEAPDEITGTIDYILTGAGTWRQVSGLTTESSYINNGAEGKSNIVINNTVNSANYDYSFVTGNGNTDSANNQFVMGLYSSAENDDIFVIGNGTDANNLSNCFAIKNDGQIYFSTNSTTITNFMGVS